MVEVHFQNICKIIAEELHKAKKSIHIAMYFFTNKELFQMLLKKADEGVAISLIIYDNYINLREGAINFQMLADKENASIYISKKENPIHDKFCIIDDCILISGSYNWTYAAENINEENIIVLHDEGAERVSSTDASNIISLYKSEYERLISKFTPQKNIIVYTYNEIDEYYTMDGKEYLMQDIIHEAAGMEDKEKASTLAKEAIALNPENIKVQKEAAKLKLVPRRRLEHAIGINLKDDKYKVIIPMGSLLPVEKIVETQTSEDNQTIATSFFYYGENEKSSKNTRLKDIPVLGTYERPSETILCGLEKRPGGCVKIQHYCNIGYDGILYYKTLPINSKYEEKDIIAHLTRIETKYTKKAGRVDLNKIDGLISEKMKDSIDDLPF